MGYTQDMLCQSLNKPLPQSVEQQAFDLQNALCRTENPTLTQTQLDSSVAAFNRVVKNYNAQSGLNDKTNTWLGFGAMVAGMLGFAAEYGKLLPSLVNNSVIGKIGSIALFFGGIGFLVGDHLEKRNISSQNPEYANLKNTINAANNYKSFNDLPK